jgi:hypothetical protein
MLAGRRLSTGGAAVIRMSKKPSERNRRKRGRAGPEFADAAINLYEHIVNRRPIKSVTNKLSEEDRRDANAMACAFILIRRLLDDCTKTWSPIEYMTSGLGQAYALLDALTSKRDWPPFTRFNSSLRVSGFRNQNAPPSRFENLSRGVIVGFVLALRRANPDLSETEAANHVIGLCQFPGVQFTTDQINKWRTQWKDDAGSPSPVQISQIIFEEAQKSAAARNRPLPEAVELIGAGWVRGFWNVPDIR